MIRRSMSRALLVLTASEAGAQTSTGGSQHAGGTPAMTNLQIFQKDTPRETVIAATHGNAEC